MVFRTGPINLTDIETDGAAQKARPILRINVNCELSASADAQQTRLACRTASARGLLMLAYKQTLYVISLETHGGLAMLKNATFCVSSDEACAGRIVLTCRRDLALCCEQRRVHSERQK